MLLKQWFLPLGSEYPVWDSAYVCVCAVHAQWWLCVYDVLHWRSFVQSSPTGENGPSESENTTFSGIWFFFSSFLAVSGLVFTGCFICLIYVPCPDCCMGPACSSHMAVPHALMRCPISRNTNRVLRPSLWLYDVWTHKSFPETPDPGRSRPDQLRGPSVYFWGGLFSVTWLTLEPYIKKRGCKTEGTGTFFQPLVIQLFISWQEILLLSNTGLDYILE